MDGRLQTGDEIVFVDSQNVLHASHHHVVQLMGSAALNGCVSLGLRRKARSLGECSAPLHRRVRIPVKVPAFRRRLILEKRVMGDFGCTSKDPRVVKTSPPLGCARCP